MGNTDWSPGEFVRYLAGNCDSENLIETFTEDALVRNAVEYLSVRAPWETPFIEGKRSMREVAHPDLPGKKLDIGMKSTKGETNWAMILEAKWISKEGRNSTKQYVQEIIDDIFRLSVLQENMEEGAHRFLLIGGIEEHFNKVLVYEGLLQQLLKMPGENIAARIWRKTIDLSTAGKIHRSHCMEVDVTKLGKEFSGFLVTTAKSLGTEDRLPCKIKTRMEGRSTSKIGDTKNANPIHVRLWEIIPVDQQMFKL
jgi:hypothetical protein